MEEMQLSETEQRYFGDLFVCCDSDKSGKIPLYKASEFFRTANLPLDVLKQITELCQSGRPAGHLGRRQFYSALKLIAAFQAGLPLRPELFHAPIDVPLPHFTWKNPAEPWEDPAKAPSPDLIQLTDSQPISKQDSISCEIETGMRTNGQRASPSSTASDSPTPTNSVQDKGWQWAGGLEEQCRLLGGTEEESSDRHSSDDDADEVWVISDEQRDYYTQQFRTLQPDLSGLIPGPAARQFLEKSRLPVSELRRVWQLADVTRDGALSLDEFNTAMHLVVLRRNHIELPTSLPSTLVPPPSAPPPGPPPPPPEGAGSPGSGSAGGGTWTKFVDSPTGSASSPGPKPVSFDFRRSAVESDPLILHPVPLRVTPETLPAQAAQAAQPMEEEPPRRGSDAIPYEPLEADLRPIQRPTPKKPPVPLGALPPPPEDHHGATGPASLPPPAGPKKEPPPPPPPRPPHRAHARSSSLDLNRLGKSTTLLGAPPVVPPRVSPSSTSPKKLVGQRSEGDATTAFSADRKEREDVTDGSGPRRHGAFQVYRKPHSAVVTAACGDDVDEDDADPAAAGTSLRRLRAQNAVLSRVCRDLHAELCAQREHRAALQLRLEALAAAE